MSFADKLARLVRVDGGDGGVPLLMLAIARRAGLERAAVSWIGDHRRDQEARISFGWFGSRPIDAALGLWQALCTGSAAEIGDRIVSLTADDGEPGTPAATELALNSVVAPLVLLERGAVLIELAAEKSGRGEAWRNGSFVDTAVMDLAKAGDWDNALGMRGRASRLSPRPHINIATQMSLWKHAYRQKRIDDVLPRLAAIPMHAERRSGPSPGSRPDPSHWRLLGHRLRNGASGLLVPAVPPADQSPGYAEAAAAQIAILAYRGDNDEALAALLGVLQPAGISMDITGSGVALHVDQTTDALFVAEMQVAARSGDLDRIERLIAEAGGDLFIDPADAAIDALIEEGDWRNAASVAAGHDPLERPVTPPFDDTRPEDSALLHAVLAAVAALGGDDRAAAAHLAIHKARLAALTGEGGEPLPPDVSLWLEMNLDGVAEGLLPRRLLPVVLPTFRDAW